MKRLVWGLGFHSGEDSRALAGNLLPGLRRPPPHRHPTKQLLPPFLVVAETTLTRNYRR